MNTQKTLRYACLLFLVAYTAEVAQAASGGTLEVFAQIAPYLKHPLVLIGFLLFLFFGIHRTLIKSRIISPVPRKAGGTVVQRMLRYGFLIAALLIVLGFSLAFLQSAPASPMPWYVYAIVTLLVLALGFAFVFFLAHRESHPPVNVDRIVERLVRSHERELSESKQQVGALQDQINALTAAVSAVVSMKNQPEPPPGIDQALAQLDQEGNTAAVEQMFEDLLARKATEGKAANKEAAQAARYLGAFAFSHDTDKALAAYRKAVELDPDNAEGWSQMGRLLVRLGEMDKAREAYMKMLAISEAENSRGNIAAAYNNLGHIHQARGEFDQAEAMHRQSLALHEALDHKEGMAINYTNLGVIHQARGEFDQAEAMHRQALALAGARGHKEGMAINYGSLGLIHRTRSEFGQAEAMHRNALALNEALGNKEGMAINYGNLGLIHQDRGELDQAEAMHRKALALAEAVGYKEGMAINYTNLGVIHQARGELDQAEAMHRQSLALHEALDHKEGMAINYTNLGVIHQARGELNQAEAMYHKALGLFKELRAVDRIKHVEELLDNLKLLRQ